MKKRILKSLVLVVLIGFLMVSATFASLSDVVLSSNNTISAGTLSFQTLDDNLQNVSKLFDLQNAKSGQTYSQDVNIKNNGSLDFDYKITVTDITGDDALCNVLKLNSINNANTYNDNLSDFSISGLSLSKNNSSLFQYSVEIPTDDSYKGESCSFNLKINAFQSGLNENSGFTFEKEIPASIQVEKLQPKLILTIPNAIFPVLHIDIENVSDFSKVDYTYTYKRSGDVEEGGQGTENLSGNNTYSKTILMGTQSGGDTIYYTGVNDVVVYVTLTDAGNNQVNLSDHLLP